MEAYFGPLQIAYRESIAAPATETLTLERKTGDTQHIVTVCLTVEPCTDHSTTTATTTTAAASYTAKHPRYHIAPSPESTLATRPLNRDKLKALEAGIASGLQRGWLLFYHCRIYSCVSRTPV